MKTKPIGIRFEQNEYDDVIEYANRNSLSFSDVVRRGVMSYVAPDHGRGYRSLAQIAKEAANADMELAFGQFLDDFKHAQDKSALIAEEPEWPGDPGRWRYDFAATAHKLAHDNGLPVPMWALQDCYVAPKPYYAFDTKNDDFKEYLRQVTPREFCWHNLFLGETILARA